MPKEESPVEVKLGGFLTAETINSPIKLAAVCEDLRKRHVLSEGFNWVMAAHVFTDFWNIMRVMGAQRELPAQPKPPLSREDISRGFDAVLRWCHSEEARTIQHELMKVPDSTGKRPAWGRDHELEAYATMAEHQVQHDP